MEALQFSLLCCTETDWTPMKFSQWQALTLVPMLEDEYEIHSL